MGKWEYVDPAVASNFAPSLQKGNALVRQFWTLLHSELEKQGIKRIKGINLGQKDRQNRLYVDLLLPPQILCIKRMTMLSGNGDKLLLPDSVLGV